MKNFLFVITLILSACGQEQIDCEFTVENLCVDSNNYPISEESIAWEIFNVEAAVNEFIPGLDLPQLIKEHGLSLKAVTPNKMKERGKYIHNSDIIKVHYIEDSNEIECREFYYVFGHELMHFIARYYLDVSTQENQNHSTEDWFLEYCFENAIAYNECVEFDVFINTVTFCQS